MQHQSCRRILEDIWHENISEQELRCIEYKHDNYVCGVVMFSHEQQNYIQN